MSGSVLQEMQRGARLVGQQLCEAIFRALVGARKYEWRKEEDSHQPQENFTLFTNESTCKLSLFSVL